MEIKVSDKYCIITPFSPNLNECEADKIASEINPNLRVGLDLSYVSDCTIEFIDKISNFKNISLFNISSDIFTLLNVMNLDKKINLFVSELDFLDDQHRIINRRFSIV